MYVRGHARSLGAQEQPVRTEQGRCLRAPPRGGPQGRADKRSRRRRADRYCKKIKIVLCKHPVRAVRPVRVYISPTAPSDGTGKMPAGPMTDWSVPGGHGAGLAAHTHGGFSVGVNAPVQFRSVLFCFRDGREAGGRTECGDGWKLERTVGSLRSGRANSGNTWREAGGSGSMRKGSIVDGSTNDGWG